MRARLLLAFILMHCLAIGQETWRSIADDDYNRAALGNVQINGESIIVKNNHVFLLNFQRADFLSPGGRYSMAKYDGTKWTHTACPGANDYAVGNDDIPYLFLNEPSTGIVVKKLENESWVNVGPPVSTIAASPVNISIGTDNLPVVLFLEDSMVKLKKFDGSNWVLLSETYDFDTDLVELFLDNNDLPYVVSAVLVNNNYQCFVKKFNGGIWEDVGVTGFVSNYFPSLAFDTANVPHLGAGPVIRKFTGTSWENFPTPFPSYPYFQGNIRLSFNSSNDLYAGYSCRTMGGTNYYNVIKFSNGASEMIVENYSDIPGFFCPFAVADDGLFRVTYDPNYTAKVYKFVGNQSTYIGGLPTLTTGLSLTSSSILNVDNETTTHDFSICNGIPMNAYIGTGNKASVKMFVDNGWSHLGPDTFSEEAIRKILIKSGTDGNIYAAYSNSISSTDTKLTVKKWTGSDWAPVGPVNFSLLAGTSFDFKLSHANEPYVLYKSGKVQKFDGNNWLSLGPNAYSGDSAARLALDSNDVPYIAFIDASNSGHIAVKKLIGGIWEYVDQSGLSGYTGVQYRPRIAIDDANNVYLGFADAQLKVHIKKLNGGLWESVGDDFFTTFKTDQYEMAFDHDNVAHVVYNEQTDNFRAQTKVKKWNGSTWELVGENVSPGTTLVGKIDFWTGNHPIVSYSSTSTVAAGREINVRYFGDSDLLEVAQPTQHNSKTWILTPNPVTDTFSVTGGGAIQMLQIYDLTGKLVIAQDNGNNVDASILESGIYFVKLHTDDGNASIKLIKN